MFLRGQLVSGDISIYIDKHTNGNISRFHQMVWCSIITWGHFWYDGCRRPGAYLTPCHQQPSWRLGMTVSNVTWILLCNIDMDHSELGLSQWEEALLCNAFSHWWSLYTEWSLIISCYEPCLRDIRRPAAHWFLSYWQVHLFTSNIPRRWASPRPRCSRPLPPSKIHLFVTASGWLHHCSDCSTVSTHSPSIAWPWSHVLLGQKTVL